MKECANPAHATPCVNLATVSAKDITKLPKVPTKGQSVVRWQESDVGTGCDARAFSTQHLSYTQFSSYAGCSLLQQTFSGKAAAVSIETHDLGSPDVVKEDTFHLEIGVTSKQQGNREGTQKDQLKYRSLSCWYYKETEFPVHRHLVSFESQ